MTTRPFSHWPAVAHNLAQKKGFYERQRDLEELLSSHGESELLSYVCALFMSSRLSLIHAEVSEALECVARGHLTVRTEGTKPEGLPIELADVFLRLVDFCAELGIDLESAVERKHRFNETRPLMHGGKKL